MNGVVALFDVVLIMCIVFALCFDKDNNNKLNKKQKHTLKTTMTKRDTIKQTILNPSSLNADLFMRYEIKTMILHLFVDYVSFKVNNTLGNIHLFF